MVRCRLRLVTASTLIGMIVLTCLGRLSRAAPPDDQSENAPIVLFDGKTLQGWTDSTGNLPSDGWEVSEGAIHRRARAGDLLTARKFDNFDLQFEWKITRSGNSGLKYRTTRGKNKRIYGCEYQLLDDANHVNGLKPTTRAGALYDLYAPDESVKELRPVGEYNSSRVVARGSRIEHWLNGRKILAFDTNSDDWNARIAKSKFRTIKDFASAKPGPILLQDHGNEVWFRNIVIQPLSSQVAE